MKKVLLSLAAVAVLASCVKENISEPVQNAGKYTIKAAAQVSKTTLAGTSVEWEATDEIAVVLDGNNPVLAKFAAVENSLNGSKADFTGDINLDGDLKFSDYNCAYAVNPSSAVDFANKKITHTLAADQTEGVKSGDLLSSAPISLEALPKGEAEAHFSNALTLLHVVVPEGVQKVEFTSDMYSSLVGTAEFTVDAATGTLAVSKPSTSRKVTLEAAEGLEAKTYPVLVYPGKVKELTLHMVGLDGAEYASTVTNLEFVAGEYRTINLCNIFGIYSEDTLYATPAGGNVLVPVVSTVDYEFTVTTDASWITYVETKGFHGSEIVLNVEANTTGAAREASVTVKWGEDAKDSRTYKVSQEALYDHFLNDANGNPIQWEESFGLYSSESDAKNETNAVVTYKNVFTIELSDDFSKGMYKVNGMLVENNSYTGKAGATYYANYVDGQLVVLKNDKGYVFDAKEVAFTYNEAEKTFTAAPIKFGYKFDNADLRNGGYIGGYKAVVKVEEPEVGADPIAGEWDVTVMMAPAFGGDYAEKSGVMVITGSNGNYVIETIAGETYNLAATFSNNVLTASKNGATLTLTYDPDARTLTQDSNVFQTWELPTLKSLVAAKQGGDVEPEVDPIAGEWDVTAQFAPAFGGDYAEKSGVMVITGSNGNYVIETIAGETFNLTATFANNTLTASKNGATLTLTYDAAVGTLTQDSKEFQTWELPTMKSLVATKQGGATPEVPVGPSVNIAGTWNQTVAGMSWPAPSATMTITVDGSSVTLTDFVAAGTVVTTTFENNQIVVPKGTAIGAGSNSAGSLDADVVLTLEGNTFTAAAFSIGGWINVSSYSATNPDMEVGGGEEPEPEVPADPWENAASFTNDGTGYGAYMKELKVYADATNMYVRLTVEKQTAYCTDAFGPLGNYLDIVLADGEGESQLWWGWTTPATKSYKLEHKGDITDGLLTKMRWYHDPVNQADRVYVDYTTEEVDGNYVYNFTYPREWVDQYAASTGKIYVSFMLWNAYKEYWVIPQTDNSMLEVTLP